MKTEINERLFLEILDWNLKFIQCCTNIEMSIYEKKDDEKKTLFQSFKIKKPKKPLPGQNIELIETQKAKDIVIEIGKNILLFQIFIKNIDLVNQSLVSFNQQMKQIHESTTITEDEKDYIRTTANILKDRIPHLLQNKSKNYAIVIKKVDETLNHLMIEVSKENLLYQKEFSEYLVNCFNYILNANKQIVQRIDVFFGVRDYLQQKNKKRE